MVRSASSAPGSPAPVFALVAVVLGGAGCDFSPAQLESTFIGQDAQSLVDAGARGPVDTSAGKDHDAGFEADGATGAEDAMVVDAGLACGDRRVEAPEACDDGDNDPDDGCSPYCAIEQGHQCFFEPSQCELIPLLSAMGAVVDEGQIAEVMVELDAPSLGDITFDFSTVDDSAVADADYAAAEGTERLSAGVTSTVVRIETHADLRFERDESFEVRFDRVSGATAALDFAEVVVRDVPPLVDRGLVVRYFLDDARRANPPLMVLDSASLGFDLQIELDDRFQPTFVTAPDRSSLSWVAEGLDGRVGAPLSANLGFQRRLDDSREATIEVVARLTESGFASRFVHVGAANELGWLTLGATPDNFILALYGSQAIQWPRPSTVAGTRFVLTLVIDSTEAVDDDRTKIYIDGQPAFLAGDRWLGLNEQLAIPDTGALVLGNRTGGEASIGGQLFYVAIYARALDATEVNTNATALLFSDDGP